MQIHFRQTEAQARMAYTSGLYALGQQEEERNDLFQNNAPFVPGVARTLKLLQLQHEALRRNRVTGDVIYPSPAQIALICTYITPETVQQLRPFMVHRAWRPNTRESGWFIGCCSHNHDHDDPAELARVHLTHLVERFAGLFPYLAFPVGYQLLFEQNSVIIYHPGKEHGQIDPQDIHTTSRSIS